MSRRRFTYVVFLVNIYVWFSVNVEFMKGSVGVGTVQQYDQSHFFLMVDGRERFGTPITSKPSWTRNIPLGGNNHPCQVTVRVVYEHKGSMHLYVIIL